MLLPQPERSVVAARAPGIGPGYWAGAPCAVQGDGEIFAEDAFQQLDVWLEARQEFLTLLPAQRLSLAAMALQEALKRAGQGRGGQAGDPAAHRAARSLCR